VTISAPRYGSLPFARTERAFRVLAIMKREVVRRARWGTLLAVGLSYAIVILMVVFDAEFASFIGNLTTATFEAPFESPVWPFLMLIVATTAGAGTIAEDVGNRSITLYLSRPIHLVDYLAAKAAACASWLVIAAVGPGVVGATIVAALGLAPAAVCLASLGAFVVVGLLAAVFFTGTALAFSSLTNRSLYAGVGIFGVILSLYVGAAVVAGITGSVYVPYASPVTDLRSVALTVFGVGGTPDTDPLASALVLLGAGVMLTGFAYWRLTRVEVVGE